MKAASFSCNKYFRELTYFVCGKNYGEKYYDIPRYFWKKLRTFFQNKFDDIILNLKKNPLIKIKINGMFPYLSIFWVWKSYGEVC